MAGVPVAAGREEARVGEESLLYQEGRTENETVVVGLAEMDSEAVCRSGKQKGADFRFEARAE